MMLKHDYRQKTTAIECIARQPNRYALLSKAAFSRRPRPIQGLSDVSTVQAATLSP